MIDMERLLSATRTMINTEIWKRGMSNSVMGAEGITEMLLKVNMGVC
jgi:hypothetical protein